MLDCEYRQHALDCGLDMTGADARSLSDYDAVGFALAHSVHDPVYCDLLLRPGTVMTRRLVEWLRSFGLDYVTVMI